MKKNYEFLDQINFPSDLKKVPETKLQKVADELREEMIDAVSVTGGHLQQTKTLQFPPAFLLLTMSTFACTKTISVAATLPPLKSSIPWMPTENS